MNTALVVIAATGWLVALGVTLLVLRQRRDVADASERRLARLSKGGIPTEDVDEGLEQVLQSLQDAVASNRDQEDRLRMMDSVVERTPTGLLLIGTDGRILEANPAFQDLVSVREDLVGRLPVEGVRLADLQALVDQVRGGEPIASATTAADNRDLELTVVGLDDDCAIVIATDITRYRQADRARTHFVSNVSHELRTPILSIMGFSETLMEEAEALEPLVARQIKAVHRNAIRLRDLFEDLLELSRIEARRSELPLEEQPLLPILERASVAAADMAYERSQRFSLSCDAHVLAEVNPEALSTIIGNLTSNACKYAGEGGSISISAWESEGQVVIEVADDGPGIDPAHHARIFERFYRVDEGRARAAGGTGLGLAIVKHLAMASRSRVTVDSSVGEGARFRVWLPEKAS